MVFTRLPISFQLILDQTLLIIEPTTPPFGSQFMTRTLAPTLQLNQKIIFIMIDRQMPFYRSGDFLYASMEL